MTEEDLMYASKEDQEFYLKCVSGLPTLAGLDGSGNGSDGIPLPYGLGSHSVRCLKEIAEIVKPKIIMEIGFNMGWSASLWLNILPECYLYSCDVSTKKETILAAEILKKRYGNRFEYKNRNADDFFMHFCIPSFYDLIFIDGSHLLNDIEEDIKLAIDLRIPFIALDDWLPQFGQVQEAVKSFENYIEQVNVNGNIALYENTSV